MEQRTHRGMLAVLLTGLLVFAGSASAQVSENVAALEEDLVRLVERISPCFVAIGGGSGVVISEDGYMLTNHHVAGERPIGEKWTVHLQGGRAYLATMIGSDALGDITLLKIEAEEKLPFLPLGDSEQTNVGELVIALGNPFLFSQDATPTVTLGIVSALHRNQGGYSDCIQTDAPINPGNSGGPLINLDGEVIGINGRIAVRFGNRINTGVGYAIASSQIAHFMDAFKSGGYVAHGEIDGLGFEDARPVQAAKVTRANGDARDAGFKDGDLILQAAGRDVYSANRLDGILGSIPASSDVAFVIQRGEERLELICRLTPTQDSFPNVGEDDPFLGVQMSSTPPEDVDGVVIEEVTPGSAAEEAGLQPRDIITAIDGRAVRRIVDVSAAIRGHKVGDTLQITILRDGDVVEVEAVLLRRGRR